ncbi:MAG: hypothetical protein HYY16_01745 [Planctomycetes bacterium]|nr:hypothetical protein [Planctomycetota bacterium]
MLARSLAVIVAVADLVGYAFFAHHNPIYGLLQPRGGIIGLGAYVTVGLALVWFGPRREDLKERLGMVLGGWLWLLMPPVWFAITLAAG